MSAASCLEASDVHGRAWFQMPCHWNKKRTGSLCKSAKELLAYLSHHQRSFGRIGFTNEELGDALEIGTRQVQVLLRKLEAHELIERDEVNRPGRRGRGRIITVKGTACRGATKKPNAVSRIGIREFRFVKSEALIDSTCVAKAASEDLCTMEDDLNQPTAAAACSQSERNGTTAPAGEVIDLRETIEVADRERKEEQQAVYTFALEHEVDEVGAEKLAAGVDLAFVQGWWDTWSAPGASFKQPFAAVVIGKMNRRERPPEVKPSPQQKPAPVARVAPPRPAPPPPTEEEVAARQAAEEEDRKVLQEARDKLRQMGPIGPVPATSRPSEEERAKMAEARRELAEQQRRQDREAPR